MCVCILKAYAIQGRKESGHLPKMCLMWQVDQSKLKVLYEGQV